MEIKKFTIDNLKAVFTLCLFSCYSFSTVIKHSSRQTGVSTLQGGKGKFQLDPICLSVSVCVSVCLCVCANPSGLNCVRETAACKERTILATQGQLGMAYRMYGWMNFVNFKLMKNFYLKI